VAFVTSDGLPVEAERSLSEDLRQRGIAVLQEFFANGKVDENGFQRSLHSLLRISSEGEFASMMRSLPPPVAFTPPAQRRQEPLQITTPMGEVHLDGHWQVGHLTTIDTGSFHRKFQPCAAIGLGRSSPAQLSLWPACC